MATSHCFPYTLKIISWAIFAFLILIILFAETRLLGGWYAYWAEYLLSFRSLSSLGPKCNGILSELDCWRRGFPNRWWYRRMRCEGEFYGEDKREWFSYSWRNFKGFLSGSGDVKVPGQDSEYVFPVRESGYTIPWSDKLWNAIPGLPQVPKIEIPTPKEYVESVLQGAGATYGSLSEKIGNAVSVPDVSVDTPKVHIPRIPKLQISGLAGLLYNLGWVYGYISTKIAAFFVAIQDSVIFVIPKWAYPNFEGSWIKYPGVNVPTFNIPQGFFGFGWVSSIPEYFEDTVDWIAETWVWENFGFGWVSSIPKTWVWENVVDWFLWQWVVRTILAYSLLVLAVPVSVRIHLFVQILFTNTDFKNRFLALSAP
jgi:hypothetical protein